MSRVVGKLSPLLPLGISAITVGVLCMVTMIVIGWLWAAGAVTFVNDPLPPTFATFAFGCVSFGLGLILVTEGRS